MLHLTPEASGYFENMWLWVADHMIEYARLSRPAGSYDIGILDYCLLTPNSPVTLTSIMLTMIWFVSRSKPQPSAVPTNLKLGSG